MLKGLPFIGKMNEFLDRALHATVQKVGPSRAAVDVIGRGYYMLNPVPSVPYVVEAGSTDEIVVLTGHPVKPGDLVRLKVTANPINEFEIIVHEVVDTNSFKLAGYLSANLTAGDTFDILRPITERFDSTGATLATVDSPPVSYNRKAAGVTTQTQVLEDLDSPTNSRALPVVIHSIDGAPIVVNAGDLSVSTSHVNDSMALGDGTNLVGVTASNELKTKDADLKIALDTLNTNDFATEAKQDTQIAHLSEIEGAVETLEATVATEGGAQPAVGIIVGGHNGAGVFRHLRVDGSGRLSVDINSAPATLATEATLSALNTKVPANLTVTTNRLLVDGSGVTQPVSVASLPLPTGAATEANQTTTHTRLGDLTEAAPASDTASSGLNGRLQRIAQRITSLIGLLPTSLGQKTMAGSLAVVLPSDQTVATQNVARVASYVQSLTIDGTTAQTFNAPANAKWCKIVAGIDNTIDLMVNFGATATATVGCEFQPGRSEDFDAVANISVIAKSATTNHKVSIYWGV